jgi:CheY-like chemotaxis protein
MSNSLRVLLVEDDDDHRELLRVILQKDGAVVDSVATVDEALWEVEDFLPDVIVSDILMPERDAFEMMEALSPRTIPVVAVSGGDLRMLARRIQSAGFAALLPKPISARSLLDTVQEVIAKRSAGRSRAGDETSP